MYKKPRKKVIGAATLITLVENIKNLKMLQKVLSSIFIQLLCYHKKLRKNIKKYTFSVKQYTFCVAKYTFSVKKSIYSMYKSKQNEYFFSSKYVLRFRLSGN